MACYLQLEQGGHLLLAGTAGALLLATCNDNVQVGGGGKVSYANSYEISRVEYLKKYEKLESEKMEAQKLRDAKEQEILSLEEKRKSDLSNTFFQAQLIRLLKQSEELRLEQEAINQQILFMQREEDDMLVILYSMPFMVS